MYYTLSTELYDELITRLKRAAEGKNYFAGRVEVQFPDLGSAYLLCSCFVHWRGGLKHDGRKPEVGDFVPVWWEFHTFDADGNELLNDFSFDQLRSRL